MTEVSLAVVTEGLFPKRPFGPRRLQDIGRPEGGRQGPRGDLGTCRLGEQGRELALDRSNQPLRWLTGGALLPLPGSTSPHAGASTSPRPLPQRLYQRPVRSGPGSWLSPICCHTTLPGLFLLCEQKPGRRVGYGVLNASPFVAASFRRPPILADCQPNSSLLLKGHPS